MVNNETLKLIEAMKTMAKNHRENATLIRNVAMDWSTDPIIHSTLTADAELQTTLADSYEELVFNLAKMSV